MKETKSDPFLHIASEAELLVSGGFIFGLVRVSQELPAFAHSIYFNHYGLIQIYALSIEITQLAVQVLAAGFTLHLLCRLLWLGFNGISKFYPMNFNGYYEKSSMNFLTNSTFQELRDSLDRFSGIVFAVFTGLLCLLVSFNLWIIEVTTLGMGDLPRYIVIWLWPLFVLASLPYLINFFTLHRFSKTRFYRWYMPVNNVLSVLTLSILYRRLIMGIFANLPRKFLLILVSVLILGTVYHSNFGGFADRVGSELIASQTSIHNHMAVESAMYADNEINFEIPPHIQIPSYTITENHLTCRILHYVQNEQEIKKSLALDSINYADLSRNEKLVHIADFYNVYFDDMKQQSIFTAERYGKYTYLVANLDLDSLSHGEHFLKVTIDKGLTFNILHTFRDEVFEDEYYYAGVPFYLVKQ